MVGAGGLDWGRSSRGLALGQELLADLLAQHLAEHRAGKVVEGDDLARHLVAGQALPAEVAQRGLVEGGARRAASTTAATRSPPLGAGTPMAAASVTSGWLRSTASTSDGATLKPPVMMSSFTRSTMVVKPSASTVTTSPVRSQPSGEQRLLVSSGLFQ